MVLTQQIKAAYKLAKGQVSKPISKSEFDKEGINADGLKLRGYLGVGKNDSGDVYWITNKCVIAVEDAEE